MRTFPPFRICWSYWWILLCRTETPLKDWSTTDSFFRCVATWWKAWGRAQTCRWSRAPQPWQPVLEGFGNPEVLDFKEPLKKSMGVSIHSNSLWLSFNIEWLMRKATMTFACFNTISAAWRASWWRPDVRNESEMRTGISMSFDLTSKCSYVHLIVKKNPVWFRMADANLAMTLWMSFQHLRIFFLRKEEEVPGNQCHWPQSQNLKFDKN